MKLKKSDKFRQKYQTLDTDFAPSRALPDTWTLLARLDLEKCMKYQVFKPVLSTLAITIVSIQRRAAHAT